MTSSESHKEELTVYEIGYLVLPSIPEDKLSDVVTIIRKVITKEGGVEIDGESPIKQPLAYSMSKTIGASRYVLSDAYFGWIKFEAKPAKILAIKSEIEKIGEVLRFLVIKAPRKTHFTLASAAKAREAVEAEKQASATPSSTEEAVVN